MLSPPERRITGQELLADGTLRDRQESQGREGERGKEKG